MSIRYQPSKFQYFDGKPKTTCSSLCGNMQ